VTSIIKVNLVQFLKKNVFRSCDVTFVSLSRSNVSLFG
jgi:hypothetical protein